MDRLQGKVAIVTGAGQGIGRALALGLAREGAAVVIAELHDDRGAAVEREIHQADGDALAVQTDVSDESSVDHMVARCLARFGRVDILVNNAGIFPVSSVEEMPEEMWDQVLGTVLVGNFLCSRAVAPHLIAQRSGRVISIASELAVQGVVNGAHYAAAKAGIIGFIKTLALELAPFGVTANALAPGLTDTALPRARRDDAYFEARAKEIPLGRVGQPEDLVGPTLFLASDAARFITGQTVLVNGGQVRW